MDTLILGAGYATRLYPLTKDRPKPLLPVGGIPIVERICRQISEAGGVNTIHLVTNHTFRETYDRWLQEYGHRRVSPPRLVLHDDQSTSPDTRLGAIGDLAFVIERAQIQDDLLVIAGDNLIEAKLGPFIQFAQAHGASVGLKDLGTLEKASLYGVVELGAEGRVIGFQEKPPHPRSTLVGVGLYYFPRKTLPLIGKYLAEGNSKDAPGYYLQWLHRETEVYGYPLEGDWYDIGDLDSYRKADAQMSRNPQPQT